MASESSKAVVIPKFDMHIYTFEHTSSEMETAIEENCIPADLHPRLPPPGMTMNRIPSRLKNTKKRTKSDQNRTKTGSNECLAAIRLYEPSPHWDTTWGHWFLFENKTKGRAKKCFKEVTMSLKGWKKKFFLLDRPCQHLELRYDIKDQDKHVIDMDTFLKLPTWTETVVSKGDPIPEDQHPKPRVTPPLPIGAKLPELTAAQKSLEKPDAKIAAAREKKEQQSLAKAHAKRAGAGGVGGSRKKQKTQKNDELVQSGFEETLSAIPFNQAIPDAGKKPATVAAPNISRVTTAKKVIVNLSGNTYGSNPSVEVNQPSPACDHDDIHVSSHPDGTSFFSFHSVSFVFFFYVFDTPIFLQFIRSPLSMVIRVISRTYKTLGQSVVARGELLKRHEQLNREYVDLHNRSDTQLVKLDRLRATASDQVEKIRNLEKDLEPKTQQLIVAEGKVRVLESEKLAVLTQLAQAEADRNFFFKEFIPAVVKRFHTSVEYQKSLAAPVQLCFTTGWLGDLSLGRTEDQVADSCDLPMDELLTVCPDVPPPSATEGLTFDSVIESIV
uniref:Uncharacterized protein n=1 Tax=Tanacetum cinerariifolium TaxID=118510 RepID=A0A6L2KBQ8_TANCI|nr:hypothetical protein [Tanacetum cinerariifolium]